MDHKLNLYSIVLNMKGKEIKNLEDVSFKDYYVILVLTNTYNIQCKLI